MKLIKVMSISLFVLLIVSSASPALAQSTDADFELAVADYQKSHTTAAAEKVIRLAAVMHRLPAIPEEARRHFVRGAALFKDATSPDDFTQVLDEFKQATDLAPWWPEARYNWALACEAAGDYANAIDHLNIYLFFKLPESESRTVQDKVYVLEAKLDKAAMKHSEQETEPIVKETAPISIEGDWAFTYTKQDGSEGQLSAIRCIRTPQGWDIVKLDAQGNQQGEDTYPPRNITGSDTTLEWDQRYGYKTEMDFHHELTLSRDGASVTWVQTTRESGHPEMNTVSKWKRVKK